MPRQTRKSVLSPTERMAAYRQRMRAEGLRLVQLWVPDSRATDFAAKCHRQAQFAELPSVVICPLTTMLRQDADQFRLQVEPSERNGLREVSQIVVDKITVVPAAKIGGVIGEASRCPDFACQSGTRSFFGHRVMYGDAHVSC